MTGSIPLIGYADRLSARPGDTISFKVSARGGGRVSARLTRSICADPNPAGPGIVEEDASAWWPPFTFEGRAQPFQAGSCAIGENEVELSGDVTFTAIICPTLVSPDEQSVLGVGQAGVFVAPGGAGGARWGDVTVTTDVPMSGRKWYRLTGRNRNGILRVTQESLGGAAVSAEVMIEDNATGGPPVLAATLDGKGGRTAHFNGRIEAPAIIANGKVIANWDLSQGIGTTAVPATAGPDLRLINHPTRAVTGSAWDGSEMCWRHRPAHYAAIHFHADDLYDLGWQTDVSFTVPPDMPSGIYVLRLERGEDWDAIPFFVSPPKGKRTADLAVLVSTFTYVIYGNHARPDWDPSWQDRVADWGAYPHNPAQHKDYGLSTYNNHLDGTGICHASHNRPLLNLRPGYVTFGKSVCSGLRHFQADSHLIGLLHTKNIPYDIVTDHQLQEDGVEALAGYKAVTTGTHPEYHTRRTLDALQGYRDGGGHLHYLGGNGFYWRIGVHGEEPGLLEIRRAEDGIRAWASAPGEYYQAFDGAYGGLWRRNGRPPQALVGVGFTAQGNFHGAPYTRVDHDPANAWIFEGIDGDLLGDFGFSGGGAAGFELDRCDTSLGTPENAVILAQSITGEDGFMLVPEEQLTHLTNLAGQPAQEVLHADMIRFEVPGGGSVFSTGSITFCGSLPWNDYDNDISCLLENVLRRALSGSDQDETTSEDGGRAKITSSVGE